MALDKIYPFPSGIGLDIMIHQIITPRWLYQELSSTLANYEALPEGVMMANRPAITEFCST